MRSSSSFASKSGSRLLEKARRTRSRRREIPVRRTVVTAPRSTPAGIARKDSVSDSGVKGPTCVAIPNDQKTGEKTSTAAPMNPKNATTSESAERSVAATRTGRPVRHIDRDRSWRATHCAQLWSAGRSRIVPTPHHRALERSNSVSTAAEAGATRRESSRIGKAIAAMISVSTLRATRICDMASIMAYGGSQVGRPRSTYK